LDNEDDRILANVLYLRGLHPESAVVLVTRDQTVEGAPGVTSDEPPPPKEEFKPRRPRRASPKSCSGTRWDRSGADGGYPTPDSG
jgi:hypothetical protein